MEEKILKIIKTICGMDLRQNMDVNLFSEGWLNSLTTIELLIEIEEELGIVIEPTEVERNDIDTPRKIVDFVARKFQK